MDGSYTLSLATLQTQPVHHQANSLALFVRLWAKPLPADYKQAAYRFADHLDVLNGQSAISIPLESIETAAAQLKALAEQQPRPHGQDQGNVHLQSSGATQDNGYPQLSFQLHRRNSLDNPRTPTPQRPSYTPGPFTPPPLPAISQQPENATPTPSLAQTRPSPEHPTAAPLLTPPDTTKKDGFHDVSQDDGQTSQASIDRHRSPPAPSATPSQGDNHNAEARIGEVPGEQEASNEASGAEKPSPQSQGAQNASARAGMGSLRTRKESSTAKNGGFQDAPQPEPIPKPKPRKPSRKSGSKPGSAGGRPRKDPGKRKGLSFQSIRLCHGDEDPMSLGEAIQDITHRLEEIDTARTKIEHAATFIQKFYRPTTYTQLQQAMRHNFANLAQPTTAGPMAIPADAPLQLRRFVVGYTNMLECERRAGDPCELTKMRHEIDTLHHWEQLLHIFKTPGAAGHDCLHREVEAIRKRRVQQQQGLQARSVSLLKEYVAKLLGFNVHVDDNTAEIDTAQRKAHSATAKKRAKKVGERARFDRDMYAARCARTLVKALGYGALLLIPRWLLHDLGGSIIAMICNRLKTTRPSVRIVCRLLSKVYADPFIDGKAISQDVCAPFLGAPISSSFEGAITDLFDFKGNTLAGDDSASSGDDTYSNQSNQSYEDSNEHDSDDDDAEGGGHGARVRGEGGEHLSGGFRCAVVVPQPADARLHRGARGKLRAIDKGPQHVSGNDETSLTARAGQKRKRYTKVNAVGPAPNGAAKNAVNEDDQYQQPHDAAGPTDRIPATQSDG